MWPIVLGYLAGSVPFAQDFAQSCNTAFVNLAGRLGRDALSRAARDFGLGPRIRLPVPAPAAQVPPGDVAVAVLVEHGRSGGSVAAPIAAAFFDALDAGA